MTPDEILAAEERRLREEADAYRVQAQGARWAAERCERLVERATFLGRPARAARLREEGARQLGLAARAEAGWRAVDDRLHEIALQRTAAPPAPPLLYCGDCDTEHCGVYSDCGEICEVCAKIVPCTRASP